MLLKKKNTLPHSVLRKWEFQRKNTRSLYLALTRQLSQLPGAQGGLMSSRNPC